MTYAVYIIIGITLLIAAAADIKYKSISVGQIVIIGIFCIAGCII